MYVNLFLMDGNIFLLGGWKHIFIGGHGSKSLGG